MQISKIRFFNKKNLLLLFIIVLLTLPATYRLFRPGFFSMYDDMQVIRLQQMDACVKDGQIPCRWVPDLGYGYGYPLYIYYAPLPYYIMEGIHLLGFSYINAVKIGFIFSVFLSGLFFYLLSRNFFSRLGSLATTSLYIYAPFRAADLYVRGAMGELWGMVSLPLVILGFEYFLKKRNNKSLVLLSLSVFIFLISHNLTILISAPLLIVWFVIRLYDRRLKFHNLKRLTYSVLLGVGLSSFFIIPLIFERNLVYIETLTQGYFNFINHFVSIKQLLFSTHWGYGPSIVGPNDDQSLGLGPVHFVAVVLSLLVSGFIKDKKIRRFSIVLFLTSFGYLFLAHSRSTPLWNAASFLSIVQFPWRFVLVAVFISSFLFGYVVDVFKKPQKLVVFISLLVVLISIYGLMFKPKDWFLIEDAEKLSGENLERQLTASIYDYLPKSAKFAPKARSSGKIDVIDGKAIFLSQSRGTDWFMANIKVESDSADVVIPTFDFPMWKLEIDGENSDYLRFGDLGELKARLNRGSHNLHVYLENSIYRKLGDSVSLMSLLFMAGYVYVTQTKKAKSKK